MQQRLRECKKQHKLQHLAREADHILFEREHKHWQTLAEQEIDLIRSHHHNHDDIDNVLGGLPLAAAVAAQPADANNNKQLKLSRAVAQVRVKNENLRTEMSNLADANRCVL